jgi:hypothetical protein
MNAALFRNKTLLQHFTETRQKNDYSSTPKEDRNYYSSAPKEDRILEHFPEIREKNDYSSAPKGDKGITTAVIRKKIIKASPKKSDRYHLDYIT